MVETRTIRVGIVGSGFMAKAHSMAYANQPVYFSPPPALAQKVCLADLTPDLAAAGASRYGWESSTADWREITRADDIDLVDIVTPNDAHRDIAIDAARHGKHVLCEKPLARTADEAREMLDAVQAAGVKHMVSFNYRRAPALRMARKLIEDGELGRIYHFRGLYLSDWALSPQTPLSWRFQKSRAGSGAGGDIGAHIIDVARFLMGDIGSVCGVAENFIAERPLSAGPYDSFGAGGGGADQELGAVDVDDAVSFLLRFDSGVAGHIEASRFNAGRKNHLAFEINGEHGSLSFNWDYPNDLQFFSVRDPAATQGFRTIMAGPDHPNGEDLWPIAGLGIGYTESTLLVVRDMLRSIVEDTPAVPTFEDGWRVNQIVDAVLESARQGRWVDTRRGGAV
ncbi:MAG TPA: Gfo/Idh/MocA family oxidoreductase [Nonomuraea sp.]|nr:Gfo/Idh/MocA family oxidoreductase [Nonomuraea sp.]